MIAATMKKSLGLALVLLAGTLLTQVGGVIIVGGWLLFRHLVFRDSKRRVRYSLAATVCLYAMATFVLIPPLAKLGGRTPLPVFASRDLPLAPRSFAYCLLNRHYVSKELYQVIAESSIELEAAFPGTVVRYLDANFPFFDGFPLLPHLSHSDGQKIDFTFFYHKDSASSEYTDSPSPIGYWIYEAPRKGEPEPYADRDCFLRWDFPILQGIRRDRVLDVARTREFLETLLKHSSSEKVLLELHLHHRFGLSSNPKVKFQQCNAARHDDHIHFQIRK